MDRCGDLRHSCIHCCSSRTCQGCRRNWNISGTETNVDRHYEGFSLCGRFFDTQGQAMLIAAFLCGVNHVKSAAASTPLTTLKTAVLAPKPRARTKTTSRVKPGF